MRVDQEERIRQNLHLSVHSFSKFLCPHFRALQGEERNWNRRAPRVLGPAEGGASPQRQHSRGLRSLCGGQVCFGHPCKVSGAYALGSLEGFNRLLRRAAPWAAVFPFMCRSHGGIQGHVTSTMA